MMSTILDKSRRARNFMAQSNGTGKNPSTMFSSADLRSVKYENLHSVMRDSYEHESSCNRNVRMKVAEKLFIPLVILQMLDHVVNCAQCHK